MHDKGSAIEFNGFIHLQLPEVNYNPYRTTMQKPVLCCLLLVCFFPQHIFSQAPGIPGKPGQFIPKGFELLDSARGDLNRDKYPDIVLVLKSIHEEKNGELTRPLLLLTGTAGGGFLLNSRNDNVVMCKTCGGAMGDPYQSIAIKNGYFTIEHYGGSSWRWTRFITFRYDPTSRAFVLHKDAGNSYHSSDPDKQEAIIHNKKYYGKLPFTKFTNETDE
jgi:hypothetical protein